MPADDDAAPRPGGKGLGAASEAPPEQVEATYDEWVASGAYDDDVTGWGYDIPERLAAIVVVAGAPKGSVLDAGCGTGRAGSALAAVGVEHVVGGDFSEASLIEARARGVYDDVVLLDLNERIAFETATFDAVLSAGVFSYVADGGATLRELLRVVRPAGVVALSQRTDLWESRSFGDVIDALVNEGVCTADISDPVPYLPGHPDFGDAVGVRLVALRRTDTEIGSRSVSS